MCQMYFQEKKMFLKTISSVISHKRLGKHAIRMSQSAMKLQQLQGTGVCSEHRVKGNEVCSKLDA